MTALSFADDFCKRQKMDPEFPAGMLGNYEVVGRMPDSDAAYTGRVEMRE